MPTDAELLRAYSDEKSEAAFGELVRRQMNLVYSIALRQCGGDAHLAEDVAQRVFTDLARKASSLSGYAVLGGWLYRRAQFVASDIVRAEHRRRAREQEAQAMQEISRPTVGDADWQKLAPVLDQAIGELPERDRDAVVLRFIEARPFAEIGATLRLTEDAARMRVERALEKLRAQLGRRGITSTSAALGLALANQAGVAAPVALATSVTGAALAAGAGGSATTGFLAFMSMTKLQMGIGSALAIAGTAGLVMQARSTATMRDELAGLRRQNQEIAALQRENDRLAKIAAESVAYRSDHAELFLLRSEAALLTTRRREPQSFIENRSRNSRPFDPTGPDRQPARLNSAAPAYPFAMRRDRINGEVVVEFTVDATGEVRSPRVVKSSRSEFEAQALAAVSKWQFHPGVKDQQAVNMLQQATVTFTISDGKAGSAVEWF